MKTPSMLNSELKLPLWRSHKVVAADCIISVSAVGASNRVHEDDSGARWGLRHGGEVVVSYDLVARGVPGIGDYYVRYDDGYESWSPARAFEDGYTFIPPQTRIEDGEDLVY